MQGKSVHDVSANPRADESWVNLARCPAQTKEMIVTTQVVILAAGMGSRLGRSLPKPLTELSDGRTIMQQQFDNIHAAFGKDAQVTIVVGYKLEHIIEAFPDAQFVYNEQYDQTNT